MTATTATTYEVWLGHKATGTTRVATVEARGFKDAHRRATALIRAGEFVRGVNDTGRHAK